MPYRFTSKEGLAEGARRIALEQIERAQDDLARPPDELDTGIHQARKRMKKLRALVELLDPCLGKKRRPEQRRFRDIARGLSGPRAAEAHRETLADLLERYDDALGPAACEQAQSLFDRRRQAAEAGAGPTERAAEAQAALQHATEAVARWPVADLDRGDLLDGLTRIYTKGHDALAECDNWKQAEELHRCRKYGKYLMYHVRLLRPAWPPVFKALRKSLKKLGDDLGDHHDLTEMRALIVADEEIRSAERDVLTAVIDRERRRLWRGSAPLAARVWAEGPKRFHKRFKVYLEQW